MNATTDNQSVWDGLCAPENTIFLDVERAEVRIWSYPQVVYLTIVTPIIMVLGLITNGSYLYVVIKIKSMHTMTNFYLSQLAVADMLHLLFSFAGSYHHYMTSDGVIGNILKDSAPMCFFSAFTPAVYIVSVVIVVQVTLDKYYAVCHPLKHRVISARKRVIKLTIAAWAFSLLFVFATDLNGLFVTEVCLIWPDVPRYSSMPNLTGRCYFRIYPEEVDFYMSALSSRVLMLIALVSIVFMYIRIVRAVGSRPVLQTQRDDSTAHLRASAQRTLRQVIRMLLANTIVFFALSAPLQLAPLISDIIHTWTGSGVFLNLVAGTLSGMNSVVNPLIYSATNARYRQNFREAFMPFLKKPKRPQQR